MLTANSRLINFIKSSNTQAPSSGAAQPRSDDFQELVLACKKADVINTLSPDADGTPLIAAICAGKLNYVEQLIAAGADVNVVDSVGITPLEWSLMYQQYEIFLTIAQNGANFKNVIGKFAKQKSTDSLLTAIVAQKEVRPSAYLANRVAPWLFDLVDLPVKKSFNLLEHSAYLVMELMALGINLHDLKDVIHYLSLPVREASNQYLTINEVEKFILTVFRIDDPQIIYMMEKLEIQKLFEILLAFAKNPTDQRIFGKNKVFLKDCVDGGKLRAASHFKINKFMEVVGTLLVSLIHHYMSNISGRNTISQRQPILAAFLYEVCQLPVISHLQHIKEELEVTLLEASKKTVIATEFIINVISDVQQMAQQKAQVQKTDSVFFPCQGYEIFDGDALEKSIREVISAKVDVNKPLLHGKYPPLVYAVLQGNNNLIRLLVSAGANVNVRFLEKPILFFMIESKNTEGVELFLQAKVDVNARWEGFSALNHAAAHGCCEIVRTLISQKKAKDYKSQMLAENIPAAQTQSLRDLDMYLVMSLLFAGMPKDYDALTNVFFKISSDPARLSAQCIKHAAILIKGKKLALIQNDDYQYLLPAIELIDVSAKISFAEIQKIIDDNVNKKFVNYLQGIANYIFGVFDLNLFVERLKKVEEIASGKPQSQTAIRLHNHLRYLLEKFVVGFFEQAMPGILLGCDHIKALDYKETEKLSPKLVKLKELVSGCLKLADILQVADKNKYSAQAGQFNDKFHEWDDLQLVEQIRAKKQEQKNLEEQAKREELRRVEEESRKKALEIQREQFAQAHQLSVEANERAQAACWQAEQARGRVYAEELNLIKMEVQIAQSLPVHVRVRLDGALADIPTDDCYVVGGALLSTLIGKPIRDIDVVGRCSGANIDTLIDGGFRASRHYKLACLYTRFSQTPVDFVRVFYVQPEWIDEDAKKRGFTIDALYYSKKTKKIVDPTGRGIDDVYSQTLSLIGTAEEFYQDPVRLLRAIKHILDGFMPDAELLAAITNWANHYLLNCCSEDIQHFFAKLDEYIKHYGENFIQALQLYGAWDKINQACYQYWCPIPPAPSIASSWASFYQPILVPLEPIPVVLVPTREWNDNR